MRVSELYYQKELPWIGHDGYFGAVTSTIDNESVAESKIQLSEAEAWHLFGHQDPIIVGRVS